MNASTFFYVIFSNTSRNGMAGLRPQVMWTSRAHIIEAAAWELNRRGDSLEDLAGIPWIQDDDDNFVPERELTHEEVLKYSVEKLGDDGRMYDIFATDQDGAEAFIKAAERYGLDDEARAIVEKFDS